MALSLLSSTSSTSSSNEQQQQDQAMVYYNLPELPTEQDITIAEINVLNWNPVNRSSNENLYYKMFSDIDKIAFPIGEDPQYDYMPYENVSPVTIKDIHGVVYKIPMILWFVLADIAGGIYNQKNINKKLPYKVFIEENYGMKNVVKQNWICKLITYVGLEYVNGK